MSQGALGALPAVGVALLAAAVVSFILTPLTIRFAAQLGAIDVPDAERRVHRQPIPRTGGLAVAGAFLIVGGGGLVLNSMVHFVPPLHAVRTPEVVSLFVGVLVGALLGYLDDRLELRARWQFIGQFLLAAIAIGLGTTIDRLPNPFGDAPILLSDGFAIAATTLWIVGMLNSVNFIDGLDGLLAGVALDRGDRRWALSRCSIRRLSSNRLCRCCAPCWRAGCSASCPTTSIRRASSSARPGCSPWATRWPCCRSWGVPRLPWRCWCSGVPIIDTFWIIIRRVSSGRSPFSADRGHFHHRLLDLGLSHRQAVLLIYAIGSLLALAGVFLSGRGQISVFLGRRPGRRAGAVPADAPGTRGHSTAAATPSRQRPRCSSPCAMPGRRSWAPRRRRATEIRRPPEGPNDPLLYSARVSGSMSDLPRLGAYLALFSEIGLVLFVTTMAGALAGHWLDLQLKTNPLLVLVGFLAGAAMGAVADYRLITRFLNRFN